MDLPESHFSGSRLNHRAPCTSSEGRLCNIFKELPLWNEFFWPVGFQLRELSPSQLSLVELRYHCRSLEIMNEGAATVLIHLLANHRCVVSVDLSVYIFFDKPTEDEHKLIFDALRTSPSLTTLKLRTRPLTKTFTRSLVATLPRLIQLRDLELGFVDFDRISLEALSEFLAKTRSLTTLTLTKLFVSCWDAVFILHGLKRNATITTLSINTHLVGPFSDQCGTMVFDYLRSNRTLRTLSVKASITDLPSTVLRPIIEALFHNDTLSELNLTHLPLDELIIDMLVLNKTLRSFHMTECFSALMSGSSMMSRWLVALEENKTLQELTLCLGWVDPDDYGSLFKALARSASLNKVTVGNFRDDHVAHICRAVRETGVQDRFVIGKHLVLVDSVMELPECTELSHISAGCRYPDSIEPLRTALCFLPTCSDVKSVCFMIIPELFNSEVRSLMAQYITNATALREVDVSFVSTGLDAVALAERTVLQALSLNNSIRRLSIHGLLFDDANAQVLVDMLDSSPMLCDLSIHPYDEASTILLTRKLSQNLSSNYTLISIHITWYPDRSGELFTVDEVERRNVSLVTRAAYFVMGTRHKHCAAAAELVHFSPALVEKVQELASVGEDEAASLIKKSLKSISELDDFMCMAGVVKHSVSCHRREDGQKQLADLNRDCWLHLRRYLKVGDILDS